MREMVTFILGGGKGTRLFPLTQYRSKPAVPLAGKYRLIDVPISNCINSGINRIYLLTQFNSVSLHRHIRQTYHFDRFDGGFVEILAAQQTLEGADWYQGTADAVRKQLRYIQQPGIKWVLILSGDQLYRMNFREMLETHQQASADVTISSVPVDAEAARAFGIMRLNDTGQVEGFLEKPKTQEELDLVRTDPTWMETMGLTSHGREYLASMGIYLFERDTLVDLLSKTDYEDFGKEVFPAAIRARKVQCHMFDGYWEDIGTIRAFYESNLELAQVTPPFELNSEDFPIYTHARFLPPTRVGDATIRNSLIADGCSVGDGTVIANSVIGLRCRIGENVTIRNSIVMGADSFQEQDQNGHEYSIPSGIGNNGVIEGAILDKNCRLGRGVTLRGDHGLPADFDHNLVTSRDGIPVVRKGACLEDGWTLKSIREEITIPNIP